MPQPAHFLAFASMFLLACAAGPGDVGASTMTLGIDTDDDDDESADAGDEAPVTSEGSSSADSSSSSAEASGDPDDGSSESGLATAGSSDSGNASDLDPPAGESSGGSGGPTGAGVIVTTASGYDYRVIHPGGAGPFEFLLVFSGVEGGQNMTNNLLTLEGITDTSHMLRAVIDGAQYNLDQEVGADVLDDVRALYDVDNDRTFVLSESAGTISGFATAMGTRQSYVAAFWGNDINASIDPQLTADELGFAPYGNCGPGGQFEGCNHVVSAMQAAGYRTPAPAPYDGPGAGTHGDTNQFIAALGWFAGKSRQ